MIFSTQNQLNTLFIFSFWGVVVGIILNLFILIFLLNLQKKYIKNLIFCIICAFLSIFFAILLNFYNFGIFSATLLLSYILGIILVKTLFNKTLVIFEKRWYTHLSERIESFKRRFKKHKKGKTNESTKKS